MCTSFGTKTSDETALPLTAARDAEMPIISSGRTLPQYVFMLSYVAKYMADEKNDPTDDVRAPA